MDSFLAKIGEFKFYLYKNAYDKLKRQYTFEFKQEQTINSFAKLSPVGKWSETFDIDGVALVQKINMFEELVEMGKSKKSWLFVSGYGEIFGNFVILSLDFERTNFLVDGLFLRQEFSMKLQRVND